MRNESTDLGALLLVRVSAVTNAWAHAQCLFWSPDVRPAALSCLEVLSSMHMVGRRPQDTSGRQPACLPRPPGVPGAALAGRALPVATLTAAGLAGVRGGRGARAAPGRPARGHPARAAAQVPHLRPAGGHAGLPPRLLPALLPPAVRAQGPLPHHGAPWRSCCARPLHAGSPSASSELCQQRRQEADACLP